MSVRKHLATLAGLALAGSLLTPTPAQAVTTELLTIGDSWNQGVGDHNPDNGLGWSPVTARALGVHVTRDGKGGSGYSNPACFNSCAGTFGQRVWLHPADAYQTVIIQGSTNDKKYIGLNGDRWDTADYAGNVNRTIRDAKKRYPSARIFIVGPMSLGGNPDAYTVKLNDTLRRYAALNRVHFIDAIREGWFVPGDFQKYSALTEPGKGHPSDAGYQVIGWHIAQDIRRAS